MDKSNTSILFSLLLGVALFLYIAYSLVRTVDSSQPDNYFAITQGVDFHEGIINAPTSTSYAQYEQADISIPDYSPENSSYIAANSETSNELHSSKYANNSGNTASANKNNESSGSNSGLVALSSNSNNQKNTSQDASVQATSSSSLTTDGTLSSGAVRQAANGTSTNGGRDPGGKNPHSSIPVGNGLLFLLFLTGIYSLWKSAARVKKFCATTYLNLLSLKNKNFRI